MYEIFAKLMYDQVTYFYNNECIKKPISFNIGVSAVCEICRGNYLIELIFV